MRWREITPSSSQSLLFALSLGDHLWQDFGETDVGCQMCFGQVQGKQFTDHINT